ncbi:HTTM domain-containing protein [Streptomyces verrucosisporus]|uniref:HTTM domain-containing protein n=1 Tax=Streptomyces verrucosisporus TaxID=1695161 RepID=UPI0019CF6703|nr:HTTM domain-containing protein [Streptomyces verrucosisporus]MBN3930805.1 HTTM domain-containing protein [Streptomyces verrucosisporus]
MNTITATTADSGAPAAPRPAPPGHRPRTRLARAAGAARTTRAPYQAALFRIAFAAVVTAFLLREWPHRRVLYGDRSPLSFDMALTLLREGGGFTVLSWWGGRPWFEAVYALTIAASLAVLVGWRTRTASVFLLVGVVSLENRNTLVGDGGDNIIRIMVIYLVFVRCARVWSLDARRARGRGAHDSPDRTGVVLWSVTGLLLLWAFGPGTLLTPGWPLLLWALWAVHGLWYTVNRRLPGHHLRTLLDGCAAMVHNCALLVIAVQICLIYSTAGWYKIQGGRWQEGSALHYVLHLDYFTPWPWLSGALASNALLVILLGHLTVVLQVAFPFTLFSRIKNVMVVALIAEHLGIAVLLGIPFLSLVMVACDALFLPTALLLRLGPRCAAPLRRAAGRPPGRAAPPPAGSAGP